MKFAITIPVPKTYNFLFHIFNYWASFIKIRLEFIVLKNIRVKMVFLETKTNINIFNKRKVIPVFENKEKKLVFFSNTIILYKVILCD